MPRQTTPAAAAGRRRPVRARVGRGAPAAGAGDLVGTARRPPRAAATSAVFGSEGQKEGSSTGRGSWYAASGRPGCAAPGRCAAPANRDALTLAQQQVSTAAADVRRPNAVGQHLLVGAAGLRQRLAQRRNSPNGALVDARASLLTPPSCQWNTTGRTPGRRLPNTSRNSPPAPPYASGVPTAATAPAAGRRPAGTASTFLLHPGLFQTETARPGGPGPFPHPDIHRQMAQTSSAVTPARRRCAPCPRSLIEPRARPPSRMHPLPRTLTGRSRAISLTSSGPVPRRESSFARGRGSDVSWHSQLCSFGHLTLAKFCFAIPAPGLGESSPPSQTSSMTRAQVLGRPGALGQPHRHAHTRARAVQRDSRNDQGPPALVSDLARRLA